MAVSKGENQRDQAPNLLEQRIARGELAAELIRPGVPTPTVPSAAQALGVDEAQILKSLLFVAPDGQVVLAVACGTTRVNRERLEHVTKTGKLKLAPPALVLARTGYAAGGTPPVCHETPIAVVIDAQVMSLTTGFGGGGRIDALLRIAPAEIVRSTGAIVADIAEPPQGAGT